MSHPDCIPVHLCPQISGTVCPRPCTNLWHEGGWAGHLLDWKTEEGVQMAMFSVVPLEDMLTVAITAPPEQHQMPQDIPEKLD